MTSAPYQRQQLRSLTGLRFLAALSVFVAHVPGLWRQFDVGDLPFGAAGVGFFYVLSGFILTYVYGSRFTQKLTPVAEFDNGQDAVADFSFKKFYLKRVARI